MLSHLKTRLASLQEEITQSVKNYSGNNDVELGKDALETCGKNRIVNYKAGCELLDYYESIWAELHRNQETNVQKSAECDALIEKIFLVYEKQWKRVAELSSLLSHIPQINRDIQKSMDTLADMESLFNDVEVSLLALEESIDNRELQEKQLDQRFQVAIYQERRQAGKKLFPQFL